jgi:hypothetical protein
MCDHALNGANDDPGILDWNVVGSFRVSHTSAGPRREALLSPRESFRTSPVSSGGCGFVEIITSIGTLGKGQARSASGVCQGQVSESVNQSEHSSCKAVYSWIPQR